MTPVITIDGPSASGKGTVAAAVAEALGWRYLDSGALYRVTALAAQQAAVAWSDEAKVAKIAEQLPVEFIDGKILLNKQAVDHLVRTELCADGASQVAALLQVRQALLTRQRAFCQGAGLVADGRDMGTVVFPHAGLKIFLTASAQVRAERRYKQLKCKGMDANIGVIFADIQQRDARDRERTVAPLVAATDARVLDTSTLSIDAAVATVLDWWHSR